MQGSMNKRKQITGGNLGFPIHTIVHSMFTDQNWAPNCNSTSLTILVNQVSSGLMREICDYKMRNANLFTFHTGN